MHYVVTILYYVYCIVWCSVVVSFVYYQFCIMCSCVILHVLFHYVLGIDHYALCIILCDVFWYCISLCFSYTKNKMTRLFTNWRCVFVHFLFSGLILHFNGQLWILNKNMIHTEVLFISANRELVMVINCNSLLSLLLLLSLFVTISTSITPNVNIIMN